MVVRAACPVTMPHPLVSTVRPSLRQSVRRLTCDRAPSVPHSMEDLVSGMASAASGWLSGWMKSLEVAKYKVSALRRLQLQQLVIGYMVIGGAVCGLEEWSLLSMSCRG